MMVPVHTNDAFTEDLAIVILPFNCCRYTPIVRVWLGRPGESAYLPTCTYGEGGWIWSTFSSRPVRRG